MDGKIFCGALRGISNNLIGIMGFIEGGKD
jgi:hypothetical protein